MIYITLRLHRSLARTKPSYSSQRPSTNIYHHLRKKDVLPPSLKPLQASVYILGKLGRCPLLARFLHLAPPFFLQCISYNPMVELTNPAKNEQNKKATLLLMSKTATYPPTFILTTP